MKIYDTESWTLLREIPVREHERAMSLSFLSDNRYLVAGTVNGLVVVWDAQTGKVVQQKKVSRYALFVKAIDRTIAVAGQGDRKLNILMLNAVR